MKTAWEDFGMSACDFLWYAPTLPPGIHDKLQTLATGHLAPIGDLDIKQNNLQTMSFPHCPLLLPNIREVIKPGHCALDVGAFIGDNSFEFTEYGLKVIGIEPYKDAFICALNNAPDALFINAAAGNGEMVSLLNDPRGTNYGMRTVCPYPNASDAQVKSLRIDDLKIQNLHLLKIDAEGSEFRVLEGARDTIARLKPVLIVEANPLFIGAIGAEKLKATIEEMGYTVTGESERASWDWIGFPK